MFTQHNRIGLIDTISRYNYKSLLSQEKYKVKLFFFLTTICNVR